MEEPELYGALDPVDEAIKKYDVYFEIYGNKMKTTVTANSESEAKNKIKNKLKFHKVVKHYRKDTSSGKSVEDLMSILGINNANRT